MGGGRKLNVCVPACREHGGCGVFLLQALHLTGDPEDYTILSQGGCCTLEDVDDAQDFAAVAEALATLDLR